MRQALYEEILTYPERKWNCRPSDRWQTLCLNLQSKDASIIRDTRITPNKWELASALQKAIRRGDKGVALNVLSAIAAMPEEFGYFWRRLCVTACEDVGPADHELAAFVIACSSIFTRKRAGAEAAEVIGSLVFQLCDLQARSRVYCSMSIIESIMHEGSVPSLSAEDQRVISAIREKKAAMESPRNIWQAWQSRNDWRAEKMLRFLGIKLPEEMIQNQSPLPVCSTLAGLPSYALDMHTRIGQEMLRRLAHNAQTIKDFISCTRVKGTLKALGMSLFYVEGGRINGEMLYRSLGEIEQQFVAHRHGLSQSEFATLQGLVLGEINSGVIDRIRAEVLAEGSDKQLLIGQSGAVPAQQGVFGF